MHQHSPLFEETSENQAEIPENQAKASKDQAKASKKYWVVVWRDLGTGGMECVAQTADLDLVKTVIEGLHTNFLIEDDEDDRIFDPEFIHSASAIAAGLAFRIRQAGCRGWPEEVNLENGGVSETKAQGENGY
jgi:hypothetical protein